MLTRFLSPMKNVWGEAKEDQDTTSSSRSPKNDLSEFCNQDQIKQYQTVVVQLIWLTGLGRFDIAVHVMNMSRFRQQPRVGHLESLKSIIGYLANFPDGSLRFRTHEPDYSNLPHKKYD